GVAEELVHPELLRTTDLGPAVQRRAGCDPADRPGHVVTRHRLEQHWGNPEGAVVGEGVGTAADGLEELRRGDGRGREAWTCAQNCVACTIENGIGDSSMRFSWASFARRYPLSGSRSVPTTDSATW